MAAALYFGTDNRVISLLEPFFKERLETAGETHSISKVEREDKLTEMLSGVSFDMFFIEESVLGGRPPKDWLPTFQKKYPLIKGPVVLVGGDTAQQKIFQMLEAGWTDFIIEPPDKSLLIEKFGLYATGKRSADIRQVYTMEVNQISDIAKQAVCIQLSEFDCKLKSKQPAMVNDLVTIFSPVFADSPTARGSVIARCYNSEPDKKAQNPEFVNSYYFVATTPEILAQIRTNLRRAYVSKKS